MWALGSRHRADQNPYTYTGAGPGWKTKGGVLLYFAYTALIDPDRMEAVSPGATFEFIAHLSGWGLSFPIEGNGWTGALPSAVPEEGSIVWGVVFSVPDADGSRLDAAEAEEGRTKRLVEAIDRTGRRHAVTLYTADAAPSAVTRPSRIYVEIMVAGSRHWSLPAGWIVGLEDRLGSGS